MDIDPKDIDVYQLLKKLKQANGTYPQELLAVRRQGYLRQVAEISGGTGLAMGLRNTVKVGKGAALPPAAGKLVESLLVVAIVAEASTVAYFYRDKLAALLHNVSRSPKVEEVASPPVISSPLSEFLFTSTAIGTPTVNPTDTQTPIGTSTLLAEEPSAQPGSAANNAPNTGSTAVATANSNTNDNDDNGNHYGLTPKPERTKEPGSDNNQPAPKSRK